MMASWHAAATQTRARELNIPPQDFMPDVLPAANLPTDPGLELAHSTLDGTRHFRGLLCGVNDTVCIF